MVEMSDESDDEEARKEVGRILVCIWAGDAVRSIQDSIHRIDNINETTLQRYIKRISAGTEFNEPGGIDTAAIKSSMNEILKKLDKVYDSACKGLFIR